MLVKVRHGDDLRRLSRDLRKEADGKALRRQFVKDVRAEVRPLQNAVKAAYQAAPSESARRPGQPSLRRSLAKATTTEVRLSGRRAGVTLRVSGKKMPEGQRRLPKLWEGESEWRHPVHGNTEVWVSQPARPTFDRIVPPAAHRVRRRIEKIATDLARRLTR